MNSYTLCNELSYEYWHYQSDSDGHYLNSRDALLPIAWHPELAD